MSRAHLVLKFGGTSLADHRRIRRAALRVRAHRAAGVDPVVVVSATGRTTDRLLRRLARLSSGPAALPPREVDRVLATGEDLSAALLAAALGALGIPARSLRGGEAGIRGTGTFGSGAIERVEPQTILRLTAAGTVPVISGFQAETAAGETVTLGRGGSDTTAVAIAAALGPADCHIVTDVPAVYDADPRRVGGTRPLPALTHESLLKLAEGGASVIHHDAARTAAAAGVPLRIYHHAARPGREGGTRIDPVEVPLEVAV